ncbi:hypothetical protein GS627_00960 [Ruegeria sp. HKCCD7318]|nr:hypothetical protein [Ruegeria sp. HKCCD7318]
MRTPVSAASLQITQASVKPTTSLFCVGCGPIKLAVIRRIDFSFDALLKAEDWLLVLTQTAFAAKQARPQVDAFLEPGFDTVLKVDLNEIYRNETIVQTNVFEELCGGPGFHFFQFFKPSGFYYGLATLKRKKGNPSRVAGLLAPYFPRFNVPQAIGICVIAIKRNTLLQPANVISLKNLDFDDPNTAVYLIFLATVSNLDFQEEHFFMFAARQ